MFHNRGQDMFPLNNFMVHDWELFIVCKVILEYFVYSVYFIYMYVYLTCSLRYDQDIAVAIVVYN